MGIAPPYQTISFRQKSSHVTRCDNLEDVFLQQVMPTMLSFPKHLGTKSCELSYILSVLPSYD